MRDSSKARSCLMPWPIFGRERLHLIQPRPANRQQPPTLLPSFLFFRSTSPMSRPASPRVASSSNLSSQFKTAQEQEASETLLNSARRSSAAQPEPAQNPGTSFSSSQLDASGVGAWEGKCRKKWEKEAEGRGSWDHGLGRRARRQARALLGRDSFNLAGSG